MRIEDRDMDSDSDRAAIDRHAVGAAGQLLMSAIWLEHRVRRFSTRLSMSRSQRVPPASVVSSPVAHQAERGCSFLTVGATERHLTKRKGRPNDYVREGR
jgi:hypothetical protein